MLDFTEHLQHATNATSFSRSLAVLFGPKHLAPWHLFVSMVAPWINLQYSRGFQRELPPLAGKSWECALRLVNNVGSLLANTCKEHEIPIWLHVFTHCKSRKSFGWHWDMYYVIEPVSPSMHGIMGVAGPMSNQATGEWSENYSCLSQITKSIYIYICIFCYVSICIFTSYKKSQKLDILKITNISQKNDI